MENGIIYKGIDKIISLWMEDIRWSVLSDFRNREQVADVFGKSFVENYSSANLFEHIQPLNNLSNGHKKMLREKLDQIYKEQCLPVDIEKKYFNALEELRMSFKRLETEWDKLVHRNSENSDIIKGHVTRFYESAITFRDILEMIPKGVVLP